MTLDEFFEKLEEALKTGKYTDPKYEDLIRASYCDPEYHYKVRCLCPINIVCHYLTGISLCNDDWSVMAEKIGLPYGIAYKIMSAADADSTFAPYDESIRARLEELWKNV